MEIREFMTLSTAHVPLRVATRLNDMDWTKGPLTGGDFGEYGWFMHAVTEDPEGRIDPELMEVFRFAADRNCRYVLFDRDADIEESLPTWDW